MGTLSTRTRKDGSNTHTGQVRFRRNGVIVYQDSVTDPRKKFVLDWMKRKEVELSKPGALEALLNKSEDATLKDVIKKYQLEHLKKSGRTKAHTLKAISESFLGDLKCSEIDSKSLVKFVNGLTCKPQTRMNYLTHLSPVFSVAKVAWGYPLDVQAMEDAKTACARLGTVGRSKQRTRRPTLNELDLLLTHFSNGPRRGKGKGIPMDRLIMFAMFSTRRLGEVCQIEWEDLSIEHSEVLVRDLKHPTEKEGNDTVVTVPPEALRVLLAITPPALRKGRIFPYSAQAVSMAFTNACKMVGIEDLHAHDLRHEGISRLFEMGTTIPLAASVSGHKTWSSLQRYAHIRKVGDKFANWPWLDKLAPVAESAA
jgi:integrase